MSWPDPVQVMKLRDRTPSSKRPKTPTTAWVEEALGRMTDPVANLPPTAQRLLAAAIRVAVTKGFSKLTIATISAESGENVAAIKYYFGNKAGLIRVMVDAVVYAELMLLTRTEDVPPAAAGTSRLVQETCILSEPGEPLRVLFELFPLALRDTELREQLRNYYETFFALHLEQLGAGEGADPEVRARMRGLASLLAAVSDGLTMQALVKPEYWNMGESLRTLDVLLTFGMPALLGIESREAGDPPSGAAG